MATYVLHVTGDFHPILTGDLATLRTEMNALADQAKTDAEAAGTPNFTYTKQTSADSNSVVLMAHRSYTTSQNGFDVTMTNDMIQKQWCVCDPTA